nr:hypothetical protein [Desulforamulus aquiferis]
MVEILAFVLYAKIPLLASVLLMYRTILKCEGILFDLDFTGSFHKVGASFNIVSFGAGIIVKEFVLMPHIYPSDFTYILF